jgi:putative DNA primase/helicase
VTERGYRSTFDTVDEPEKTQRSLTDDGNAYRLVDEHGTDLRYVPGVGWYAWDGTRWLHDVSGEPMRRARHLADQLHEEARLRRSEHGDDDPVGKAMRHHAKTSASRRGLEAMLAVARSDRRVIVDVAELDADPLLLNAPNGTIDLRTGLLRSHERGDLITRRVAVEYDPTATAPTWEAFLARVQPDEETRNYLQRTAGAAAIGDNRDELLHVKYGPGANGKTKFDETVRTALGDYAEPIDAELLLAQRGRSAAKPELVRLRGVRLVTASETDEGRRLNTALVKALTGGDAIPARLLYENNVAIFTPVFSPWLRTNHRPVIGDQSEAIWRRVRLVPFTVTIPRSERNTMLQGQLFAELPGVLRWIVDGARVYLEHGLDPPEQVAAATEAYREEEDLLGAFIAECCDVDPAYTVTSASLYGVWSRWCDTQGEKPGTAKDFGIKLEEAGYEAIRLTGGVRARKGLQIRLLGEEPKE